LHRFLDRPRAVPAAALGAAHGSARVDPWPRGLDDGPLLDRADAADVRRHASGPGDRAHRLARRLSRALPRRLRVAGGADLAAVGLRSSLRAARSVGGPGVAAD